MNITLNSAVVQWIVASIAEEQEYTLYYDTDPADLNSAGNRSSGSDITVTDAVYELTLDGLTQGTMYYVQVVSTFGIYTLRSELVSFSTIEPGISYSCKQTITLVYVHILYLCMLILQYLKHQKMLLLK